MAIRFDIQGQKFGRLTVLRRGEDVTFFYKKQNRTLRKVAWVCLCDCGKEATLTGYALRKGVTKSCGCLITDVNKKRLFTGFGEISGSTFYVVKSHANKRDIIFNLSIEYLNDLFILQNRKCALTGMDIFFTVGYKKKKETFVHATASLDRIDSSKPYEEGNVQWVHKTINMMKNTLNQDEFIQWCKNVCNYSETTKNLTKHLTQHPK